MAKKEFIYCTPIHGLEIADEIGAEVAIDGVTFVASKKIPRIRKRVGLKATIAEYNARLPTGAPRFFESAPTYAILRRRRDPNSRDYSQERVLVREAVAVLASSLFWIDWRQDTWISIAADNSVKMFERHAAFERASRAFQRQHAVYGSPLATVLDRRWREFNRSYFFGNYAKIRNGTRRVAREWSGILRRVVILVGQSQLARSVPEAFLLNMIAIEALLARRGDSFPDALISRVVALHGWMTDEDPEPWRTTLTRLYKLRCSFVHDGLSGDLTPMDLFQSDELLFNLLVNAMRNTHVIRRKQDVVDLAAQMQARQVLGLKARRPTTSLSYHSKTLNEGTKRRVADVHAWSW
jgi:hypothetical protein